MTSNEIDETTADPFCGFNLGSTVYRATSDRTKPPRKYIFESPVVQLAAEFKYRDVYEDGYDILDPEWDFDAEGKRTDNRLQNRSIVVFRYYDEASKLLGLGKTPPIDVFAKKLGELILRIRDLVAEKPDNDVTKDAFRCYLVAHSMGGLVCRAFLQDPKNDPANARRHVEKLFTYATPHNGIEMAGVNVPKWLRFDDINNFNQDRMKKYLALPSTPEDKVHWIPEERFPIENVFCMVGTNRLDYEVAMGLSRTFVGHGSDGLVKIENATACELKKDGTPGRPAAKAFAFRAHSGYFGIVNSVEAFQNLARFLFGDVRVDLWVDITGIRLPKTVAAEKAKGRDVRALYQVEVTASPKGKLWYLTRRSVEEDSAACVTQEQWEKAPNGVSAHFLSTVFLSNRARVDPSKATLSYNMTLGIRVPDYEIDRKLWINQHYEGGYLYRDALILLLNPPGATQGWGGKYAWQGKGFKAAQTPIALTELDGGKMEGSIAFSSGTSSPGIDGNVRFVISAWNKDAADDDD